MVSSTVLSALYIVNKHAKQFASDARQANNSGNRSKRDFESGKKDALYTVKEKVLHQIYPQSDRVEKHTINGETYYHFEFEDEQSLWQFHIPTEAFTVPSEQIESQQTLTNFESTQRISGVSMTLKEALRTINSEFNINANNHLPRDQKSTVWPYLY